MEGLRFILWILPYPHISEVVRDYEVDAYSVCRRSGGRRGRVCARHTGGAGYSCRPRAGACRQDVRQSGCGRAFERLGLPIPPIPRRRSRSPSYCQFLDSASASKGIVEINSLQKLYELQGVSHRYLIQERIDNRRSLRSIAMRSHGAHRWHKPACAARSVGRRGCAHSQWIAPRLSRWHVALEATGCAGCYGAAYPRPDNGRYMVMEINPRLGGGAVASVYSWFNLPAPLLPTAPARK